MPSERIQRRIDRVLDQAEEAAEAQDWAAVERLADEVLGLDAANEDAPALLSAARRRLGTEREVESGTPSNASSPTVEPTKLVTEWPTSFAGGRYEVRRFLGEGGKKRVFLAHDTRLDRDVAFALIKTDGLDATGRERITRETQAMGRLGAHPHIVTIFEIGEENGSPYEPRFWGLPNHVTDLAPPKSVSQRDRGPASGRPAVRRLPSPIPNFLRYLPAGTE